MSLTLEHGKTDAARHLLARIVDAMLTTRDRHWRHFSLRRTRRKLRDLPDWILRDIGLDRGDIEALQERASERTVDGADRSWQLLP